MNLKTQFRFLVYFFLLLGFGTAWANFPSPMDINQLTYKDLGQQRIIQELFHLEQELAIIKEDTLPHQVKALRKNIGKLRGLLDLFAYSFGLVRVPGEVEGTTVRKDLWKKFRKDLDKGYARLGDFKDLYDLQSISSPENAVYDPTVLSEKRDRMILWKERFLTPERLARHKLAISKMKNRLYKSRTKLTKFYWGPYINNQKNEAGEIISTEITILPSRRLNGFKNIAKLLKATLNLAMGEFDEVVVIESLLDHDSAEAFHDFRKRIRMVVKHNIPLFPEVIQNRTFETTNSYLQLLTVVDNLGSLNDRIISLEYNKKMGNLEEVTVLEKEIELEWKGLKGWLISNNIKNEIAILMTAFELPLAQ